MSILVFISYDSQDSNRFQVPRVAEELKKCMEIDNVSYWEEDLRDDIYQYMNKNLGICDVFLIFCSQNALQSEAVELEWMVALKMKKKIIPIFLSEKDIPPLLTTKLRVRFSDLDFKATLNDIYRLILKKMETLSVIKDQTQQSIIKNLNISAEEARILELIEKNVSPTGSINWDKENIMKIERNHIIELNLNRGGLGSLPESFGNLKSLRTLWLSENLLKTLPESIEQLRSLQILGLNKNQLTILPESFGQLNLLSWLNLQINNLKKLPESFGALGSLRALYLDKNQLISLPNSIGKLKLLDYLILHTNKLTTLPDSFGDLKSLEHLDLRWNQLTVIPEPFGTLKNLKYLNLGDNQLTSLPESFGNLKSLKRVFLENNQITTLPDSFDQLKSLQTLWLNNNQLTTLPEALLTFSDLETVAIAENPLGPVAKQVVNQLKEKEIKIFD